MGFFVIVPIVITLIIVAAIYSHRKEKERQQEMRLFADQNGWYFTAERDRQHHKKFSQFKNLQPWAFTFCSQHHPWIIED